MKWTKLRETDESQGWRKVFSRWFLLPNGVEKAYDISVFGPAATGLALTEDNQVVLVKQFRPGPEKVLIELPGGVVDPGESPEVTMARELLEETGFAGEVIPVCDLWLSAYSTGKKYGYLIRNCRKVQEPKPEDDEFIEVVLMPLEEFRNMVDTWDMVDTAIAYRALRVLDAP